MIKLPFLVVVQQDSNTLLYVVVPSSKSKNIEFKNIKIFKYFKKKKKETSRTFKQKYESFFRFIQLIQALKEKVS